MPRIAWNRLIVLLFALPLASCIGGETSKCSTCPRENSARIVVFAQPLRLSNGGVDTLRLDSILVRVDGGPRVRVLPGQRVTCGTDLVPGIHGVNLVRWFLHNGLPEARTTDVQVSIERGETRTIVFQHDFPLISWQPLPTDRADELRSDWTAAHRMG